jgi:hypothetical protein
MVKKQARRLKEGTLRVRSYCLARENWAETVKGRVNA